MKILGIIPARYASSRFPGKPLAIIAGKSMIQRVYEQCMKAKSLDTLVVATDDERILNHVLDFGGLAILTSPNHLSGTDRCQEVSTHFTDHSICINIQGDEPLINPEQIDKLSETFIDQSVQIASMVKVIVSDFELNNENSPKVVLDKFFNAIYFSRFPIPFSRSKDHNDWLRHTTYYKHIGIYAFRRHVLDEISNLTESNLEKAEALEQLRWIENGYKIRMTLTDFESQAIDTPADLQRVLKLLT